MFGVNAAQPGEDSKRLCELHPVFRQIFPFAEPNEEKNVSLSSSLPTPEVYSAPGMNFSEIRAMKINPIRYSCNYLINILF
jgi:hypothetical protein